MVDENKYLIWEPITEALQYCWRDPKKELPDSSNDLYWVIIRNKNNNLLEVSPCNYNIYFKFWEILEYEEVLAWMPFYEFLPKIPYDIVEVDNEERN